MGYERNDRRYGREGEYRSGGYGRDYGRERDYSADDRGFFDRAGDEVRSWFGDEEAERRRRLDERYDERGGYGRDEGRGARERTYPDGGRFADPARYGGGGFGGAPRARSSNADWWRGEDHFQGQDRWQGQDRSSDFARYSDRDRDAYRGGGFGGHPGNESGARTANHDASYRSWRDRQVDALDRDYDEYRREHASKFENDFGTWRRNRETQRGWLNDVREHQDVVGSDGSHVGTVDKVRGDRIILTKTDQDAGGHHHSIPSSWITSVAADKVTLGKTADQAKQAWKDEERSGAFFGGDPDDRGAHNLNRSFSGTY